MRTRGKAGVSGLLFVCAGLAVSVLVEGATDLPLGPGYNTILPPAFNSAQGQQLANIFTSCAGPQVQAGFQSLNNMAQGGPGMGQISINTVCPEGSPVEAPNSCDMFSIDGLFDPSQLASYRKRNDDALVSLMCKKGKFLALQGELQCLMNQAHILSQQIGSIQASYLSNIQRMQQDVQQLKSIEEDRKRQGEEVQARLGGRPGLAEPGLVDVKNRFEQVYNAMPQDIQGVRELYINLANQRKSLDEQVQARTMVLATECFKTASDPSYRCTKNGRPVTAIEYVLCRYKQNQQIGEEGRIEQDQGTRRNAEANAAGLESLLSTILSSTPTNGKVPLTTGNPQQDQAAMEQMIDQPMNILSAADVEAQYGEQLAQYNGKGLDIREFVLGTIGNCFNKATRRVEKERKRANTGISRAQEALKAAERTTADQVATLLNKYQSAYSEAMRSLTGLNLPMNLNACKGTAKPSTQINCLTEIQSNMEGMLNGSTANSTIDMVIRSATDPRRNIPVQCQGLNGCIRKLQNVGRELVNEQNRVKAYREQYVKQANQNIQTFTQRIANYLSPQSQALTARLAQLNTALASLGVSSPIDLKPLEAEQLQPDPNNDGLFGVPQNVLKLVGGNMNPPMLDMSGNAFGSSLSGVAEGQKSLDKDIAQANENMTKLVGLERTCRARPIRELVNSLQSDVRELGTSNCQLESGFCGRNGRVEQLIDTIRSLEGTPTPGLDPIILTSLSRGTASSCPSSTAIVPISGPSGTPQQVGQQMYTGGRCRQVAGDIEGKVDRIRSVQTRSATQAN